MALQLQIGHASDVGRAREANEDNYGFLPRDAAAQVHQQRGELFLVADGMGGYLGGATASQLAVQTILNAYYADSNTNLAQSLQQAIAQANMAIRKKSLESDELAKMGTTVVAAVIRGDQVFFANVGDSRGYIIPPEGPIRPMTRDHSWVAEQVAAGVLTEEQARTHPQRNVITRSLGQNTGVEVDVFQPSTLQVGDTVLLCSDGLTNLVTDAEIAQVVRQEPPQQAANRLVFMANERGGHDNITVIVVRALPAQAVARARARARRTGLPRWVPAGLAGVAALIIVGLGLTLSGVIGPDKRTPTSTANPTTSTRPPLTAAPTAEPRTTDTPSLAPTPPLTGTTPVTPGPIRAETRYAERTATADAWQTAIWWATSLATRIPTEPTAVPPTEPPQPTPVPTTETPRDTPEPRPTAEPPTPESPTPESPTPESPTPESPTPGPEPTPTPR